MTSLFRGDLGDSLIKRRPVTELIGAALPNSIKLVLSSFILSMLLSLVLVVLAATRRDTWVDNGVKFIAHNLAMVRYMSHSVAIMYLGQIVEYGDAEDLFDQPLHPYTKALISASLLSLPENNGDEPEQIILSGEMPSPLNPPTGCRFHTRCEETKSICKEVEPKLRLIGRQQVRCHL